MDLSHDEGEGAAAPKLSSRAAKNALTSAEKKKLRKKNQALKKKKSKYLTSMLHAQWFFY